MGSLCRLVIDRHRRLHACPAELIKVGVCEVLYPQILADRQAAFPLAIAKVMKGVVMGPRYQGLRHCVQRRRTDPGYR